MTYCSSTLQDKKLAARLSRDQKDFRKFFLSLIASETCRNEYLSKKLDKEFGEDFQATFQKLTQRFISKIEEKLPETEVERVIISYEYSNNAVFIYSLKGVLF